MYRIDFENINDAAEIIYCFMTIPALTNPECTIWSESGIPDTIAKDSNDFLSEEEFCRKIASVDFAAISCVASTDKADERRVVLNLMPGTDYLVLNFSSADGKPNEAERRLLKLLEI